MSIHRLDIPEGVVLPTQPRPDGLELLVADVLTSHFAELVHLGQGQYDVTPRLWTDNTHRHELTVFDNGEGMYRMYPRRGSAGVISGSEGGIASFHAGGAQQPVNAEQPLTIIAGGHPVSRDLRVFGLIAYLPEDLGL